jgi:hypothetical protein
MQLTTERLPTAPARSPAGRPPRLCPAGPKQRRPLLQLEFERRNFARLGFALCRALRKVALSGPHPPSH